ncbi:hypothetical protein ACFV23_15005, partial [Streptomyces sp. NPDC059627]
SRLAETGQQQAALNPAQEAVRIRRQLVTTNPAAYLPDLALSLNNLANHLTDTGNETAATQAYTDTATALAETAPAAARTIEYERAAFQLKRPSLASRTEALKDLISLLDNGSADKPAPTALRARHTLRTYARASLDNRRLFEQVWQERTSAPTPDWLSLTDGTLDLVASWINTVTWQNSKEFWSSHTDRLSTEEVSTALAEYALVTSIAAQHQELRQLILSEGPDAVFRPLILRDLLTTWLECEDWEASQRFLEENADLYADETAEALLVETDPYTPTVAAHVALLYLARTEGVDTAYRRAQDPEALRQYVLAAIADGQAGALAHAAAIESAVFGEELASAAHFQAALLLANRPDDLSPDDLAATAAQSETDPETRNRLISELATLSARPGQDPAQWLRLIQALTRP